MTSELQRTVRFSKWKYNTNQAQISTQTYFGVNFSFKYTINLLQLKHQHFSNTDSNHNSTPCQNRTQLDATHLLIHSQRGIQAGEDKNAACLRRRQKQQTHQRMFISTSNTEYTIPGGRTASSWVGSLNPPAHRPSTLSSTQSPLSSFLSCFLTPF